MAAWPGRMGSESHRSTRQAPESGPGRIQGSLDEDVVLLVAWGSQTMKYLPIMMFPCMHRNCTSDFMNHLCHIHEKDVGESSKRTISYIQKLYVRNAAQLATISYIQKAYVRNAAQLATISYIHKVYSGMRPSSPPFRTHRKCILGWPHGPDSDRPPYF